MAVIIKGRRFNVNNGVITDPPPIEEPEIPPVVTLLRPPDTTLTSVSPTPFAKPGYLVPVEEISYGELPNGQKRYITRVTDSVAPNAPRSPHHYSKTPVWNCDGSLMLINEIILDGKTGAPIRPLGTVDGINPQWSNIDPDKLFIFDNRIIRTYKVSTGVSTIIRNYASEYTKQDLGPNEGNISDDDRYAAFDCTKGGVALIEVVDLVTGNVVSSKPKASILTSGYTLDFCTITPSGNYVAVRQTNGSVTNVIIHDRNLNPLRTLSGGSHPDFGYNQDDKEVMVTVDPISYTELSTGIRTICIPNSTIDAFNTGPQNARGGHSSIRNKRWKGWAFISLRENNREVFAVKLDTSGTVKRFGFTRDGAIGEANESCACPNPDGTKVIAKGIWGASTGEINSYVFEVK